MKRGNIFAGSDIYFGAMLTSDSKANYAYMRRVRLQNLQMLRRRNASPTLIRMERGLLFSARMLRFHPNRWHSHFKPWFDSYMRGELKECA